MKIKLPSLAISFLLLTAGTAKSQLNITSGATFFIQAGGVVTVQGDVTSATDIQGPGKILLKGSTNQNVNMNGFTIPNLEMDNVANATLTGNTRIGTSLLFTNGKIFATNFNLNLGDLATSSGMASGIGTSKFVETNGTGQVIKETIAALTANEIPIGVGTNYRPAFLTTSSYTGTNVGFKVLAASDPNKPPSISDYITTYWPITRSGTGTVTVAGQYIDADISGLESNLRGYYFNGTDWSSATETHNNATNQVSSQIALSGDLSAMDKFDLVKTKAFLQGAYTGSGAMSDALRTSPSLIPLTDPYRTAPYNVTFTHTPTNLINESAPASVFADNFPSATETMVDWVFLELRDNASPGNTVLQTRSALIQKDGDIVDMDGVSPVTFNNIATANYTVAVRHRNHLGISTDPLAFQHLFGETKSTAPLVDFTTATDANLFGNNAAYAVNTSDSKVMLWSGNANVDTKVKYSGSPNDPQTILNQVLAFPGNTGGLYNYSIAIGYFSGDINMDRKVRYSGSPNDPQLILNNVLAYPLNTAGLYNYSNLNQQLPN